jgi:glyoxylase-like metal-dependent hydrolase (beta-lactamase superfamily II)
VLTQIGEGIHAVEMMLALPLGLRFPTRCTVVRMPDESLLMHSPVALDDATTRAIEALGEVRTIVAPSLIHHLFVKEAHARFPKARVFATPTLRKKIPGLPGTDVLETSERFTAFPGLPATFHAGAPAIDETVFFHEASGSLLCTDMVFNVTRPSTFGTRFFLSCVGCNGRFGQSRVWRLLGKDKGLLASRIRRVFDFPFDRVVMGHGDVVDTDAYARTREALARHLAGESPRLAA